MEQFGESIKHGSEEGANEADDGSSSGPVLLPLGEDVGSRWPSEAGHGPWIATAESVDDAFPLPLMDLNGGDSQGSEDGRIRECGVQHLAVHSGAIEHESGVRMIFAMADNPGLLEPVEHEHVESTVVCEDSGGRNGNRQEWKGLMDRARAGCWSWPSGETPGSDDSSKPHVEERRSSALNQKAC